MESRVNEIKIQYTRSNLSTDKILNPEHAFKFFNSLFEENGQRDVKEHFLALFLDSSNKPLGFQVVSIGSLNATVVHPREIFSTACKCLANSIMLCHNHPSGNLQASTEDIKITERLVGVGQILGIDVLDHIIIATKDSGEAGFFSMLSEGYISRTRENFNF